MTEIIDRILIEHALLKESEIYPSDAPNTMSFWHGGNLDDYDETVAHKKGRYEYGAGLYLITDYSTAHGYSKGARKLYMITVAKGTDITEVKIPVEQANQFVKTFVVPSARPEIMRRIESRTKEGFIPAFIFNNIIINNNAIAPKNTPNLRKFMISLGIDYQIVRNAFGTGATMLVLYDMKKIVDVRRIMPKDKIMKYELDAEFN